MGVEKRGDRNNGCTKAIKKTHHFVLQTLKKLKNKEEEPNSTISRNKSTKNSSEYTEIVKFDLTKTLNCVLLEK